METLVKTSKTVPVTGSVLIDQTKVRELVDQLRVAVPQEVRASQEVLARKDHIINQSLAEARRTKTQAEDEFRERLDHSELVEHAQKRAAEIVSDAEQRVARKMQQSETEAQSRRTEADLYAMRNLRALERELNNLVASVRKGIGLLAPDEEEVVMAGNGHQPKE